MPNISIEHLIGHGHFFNETFKNADEFVRYCKERDLDISLEKLERLERLGIFLPLLRVRWPKIKIKIAPSTGGEGYEELGVLQDGEVWDGEIEERYGGFIWWDNDTVQSLIKERQLWVPHKEIFQDWKYYRDKNGDWEVISYYSIFQTLSLSNWLRSTTLKIGFDDIFEWSRDEMFRWFEACKPHAESLINHQTGENIFETTATLCQALSSRYFRYVQSDGATISVPHPDFFDWNKYKREWKADHFLTTMGLSENMIVDFWNVANGQASFIDPLDNWQDFVSFFKQNKKDQLKGKAQLAQTFRAMAEMLNLFSNDLIGKKHYEFDRSPSDRAQFYGEDTLNNDLKFLEYLSNQYGVNPRPKLMLVVEGDGEAEQFPRLAAELLPPSFPKLRIAVTNIKNAGELKNLKRFIDHYHSLQTIVFIILDKENNAAQIKESLCKNETSIWSPNRSVTKEEYIHLWDKNVELDNFTDEELAKGMTTVSANRYSFSVEEIAACRNQFGGKRDPLSALFKEKLNYGLPKRELLKILFDYVIASPLIETAEGKQRRPIIDVLLKVQRLALRNYQPSRFDAWQEAQNSSWLGNLINPS